MRCKWESGMCFLECLWLPGKRDKHSWLYLSFLFLLRSQVWSGWWSNDLLTTGQKPKRNVISYYWAVQTMPMMRKWTQLSFLLLTVQQIVTDSGDKRKCNIQCIFFCASAKRLWWMVMQILSPTSHCSCSQGVSNVNGETDSSIRYNGITVKNHQLTVNFVKSLPSAPMVSDIYWCEINTYWANVCGMNSTWVSGKTSKSLVAT